MKQRKEIKREQEIIDAFLAELEKNPEITAEGKQRILEPKKKKRVSARISIHSLV